MAELSAQGAVIKLAYEGEADTNAFTDERREKLDGIATGANRVATGTVTAFDGDLDFSGGLGGGAAADMTAPEIITVLAENTRMARPASYFGIESVEYGAVPSNNLAALQAAIDWSASTGGVLALDYGITGFDGTLDLKANASIVGLGEHASTLKQLDTAWADCLVPSHADGNGQNLLANFTLDGGWDLTDGAGGGNWVITRASMTQIGIQLTCPSAGPTQTRDTLSDMQSRMYGMRVRRIAGKGIDIGGRGEVRIDGLLMDDIATDGIYCAAPDNWITNASIFNCGDRALVITKGDQRVNSTKLWFIGRDTVEVPTGGAFDITDAGANGIQADITVQDTWGTAATIRGNVHQLRIHAKEVGNLLEDYGYGVSPRTGTLYGLTLAGARDSWIDFSLTQRKPGTTRPPLVRVESGNIRNRVRVGGQTIIGGMVLTTEGYDTDNPVSEDAGSVNAKRFNIVEDTNGALLLGAVTEAQLLDAEHGCNEYVSVGTSRVLTDGRAAVWDGSQWKISVIGDPTFASLSASRDTVAADDGADIECTAAATLTIVAGTITRGLTVSQMGAGAATIAAGVGVTINKESDVQAVTNGQYAVAFLKPTGTVDTFILTGSLAAV